MRVFTPIAQHFLNYEPKCGRCSRHANIVLWQNEPVFTTTVEVHRSLMCKPNIDGAKFMIAAIPVQSIRHNLLGLLPFVHAHLVFLSPGS